MKVDFSKEILSFEGKAMLTDENKPVTLGLVAINALVPNVDEGRISGLEQVRRAELAEKIYQSKEPIEIPDADRELLKNLIHLAYQKNNLIVYRAYPLLDGQKKSEN